MVWCPGQLAGPTVHKLTPQGGIAEATSVVPSDAGGRRTPVVPSSPPEGAVRKHGPSNALRRTGTPAKPLPTTSRHRLHAGRPIPPKRRRRSNLARMGTRDAVAPGPAVVLEPGPGRSTLCGLQFALGGAANVDVDAKDFHVGVTIGVATIQRDAAFASAAEKRWRGCQS